MSIISHKLVTNSDLRLDRPLYCRNVSKFLQTVLGGRVGVGWRIKIPGGIGRVMDAMR